MSQIKAFAEEVSVATGRDGELTKDVLAFAQKLLDAGLSLRIATVSDIPAICGLVAQLSPMGCRPNYTGAAEKYLTAIHSSPDYFLWAVEKDGEVVGTGMLHLQHKLSFCCGTAGHLEDVVVDEKYRGQGIGQLIVEVAKLTAQSKDCYKLMLTCYEKTALYYEELGFKRHDIGMRLSLKKEYE